MKTTSCLTAAALIVSATLLATAGCKSQSEQQASFTPVSQTATTSPKPYPLEKCVVSGEAFEHGQPYTFVYNGQEIKLCCKDCLADFNKDPQKFLAKIDAAK